MFGNKERTATQPIPKPPTRSTPRSSGHSDAITAYLGPDTRIEGTLRFENSVLIEGKFKGEIQSETGTLVVGESADVEATIKSGNITIRGKVTGSVIATERVHLQDRGSFSGELTTPSLQMDESVTFEGSCSMPKPGQSPKPNKPQDHKREISQNTIIEAVESVRRA